MALVAGLCVLAAVIFIATGAYRFYCKWVQRHAVFNVLDLDSDISTMTDHEQLQALPCYSKSDLLRTTSLFPRPKEVRDGSVHKAKAKMYQLDKERHRSLWHFVTSKFRSKDFDLEGIINRIEFVRSPESKELDFRNRLFESSRAEAMLLPEVKFENCHRDLVATPLFQDGLRVYRQRYCSKLEPGLDDINLMFAWHGCRATLVDNICDLGMKKVARSTDPGFFGEACYLSPECVYALRYSSWYPRTNEVTKEKEIGVILFACECPKTPYVVTSADYPIAVPPLRDPGIPYGFSKFFGRQMQLACAAHWVAVKKYPPSHNHLHTYFGDESQWDIRQESHGRTYCYHKLSGKSAYGSNLPHIPSNIADVQKQTSYKVIDQYTTLDSGHQVGANVYQYQTAADSSYTLPPGWTTCHSTDGTMYYSHAPSGTTSWLPPPCLPPDPLLVSSAVSGALEKNPDNHEHPSLYHYPNMLLPSLLDYQYHPEEDCEGHELVVPEGKSLPIAVVWFKHADYERQVAAAEENAKRDAAAAAASVTHTPPVVCDVPGSCHSSYTEPALPSRRVRMFPSPPPVVPGAGALGPDNESHPAASPFLSRDV